VGDHLGVGLRCELGAGVEQTALQREVVLDDPVDDDVDAVARVEVRVGVGLGDAAVRRPARVPDAARRGADDRGDGAEPSGIAGAAAPLTAVRRLLRLPTARTDAISPSTSTETPAES
jgi:hypothetical protein